MGGLNMSTNEKKLEILQSFYETVKEEGMEGASVAKIAKRIGIPQSLIFHYFSSKQEMIYELCDYVLAKYFPYNIDGESERERFKYFIDELFKLKANKEVNAGVFYTFFNMSFRNLIIMNKFHDMYQSYRNVVTEQFRYFNEKEVIRTEDIGYNVDCLLAIIEGLSVIDTTSVIKKTSEEEKKFWDFVEKMKNDFLDQIGFK
jgi:AcrR family transcriptional regulator